ncbi:kinase-like protein [Rhizophagus irregularis]|uniref:Kinase-like protein n=1 Tax=Rhizophagus irregularis TaxID=588596 RepID=A0A2N0RA19_9GLOM|nr:kinase-like protein [Rhizophagus irregularis]
MSNISKFIKFFSKGKRRNENEIENPRIEIIPVENDSNDSAMAIDYASPLPSPSSSTTTAHEVSRELKRLRLDNSVEDTCVSSLELSVNMATAACTIIEGASNVAQNFAAFAPLIKQFFDIAKEVIEPLLEGQFQKANVIRSKKIEKRTAFNGCSEYCFKEVSNNSSSSLNYSNTQIEIRRQVNILKELKNSNHIIKFFGVAQENSKFYLVTEWMDFGNLYEYYTNYRENMNWKTKIRFALDICRGVSYLNDCHILHHDIQSANILVNEDHKVKIANFGLSKKFSEFTRNISHNIENVRYMAPEKLLIEDESNNSQVNNDIKRKKVPYDSKCEIYSVGALLWEIAELKKPHSDIVNTEMLIRIRERVRNKYREPLSDDVPEIWKYLVKRSMEHEPEWRLRISEICFNLYELSKKYYDPIPKSPSYKSDEDENLIIDQPINSFSPTILSVEDAIREHKSNGNKQLAWESFKYHSESNSEAKYWLGYYYYYAEIPELQQLDQDERHKFALKIFRETADKGNPSAQLRYGMHLWKVANYSEAIRYLEMSANSGNSTAMYNIGSAYWNGNFVIKDQDKGARYLKEAAMQNQPKAIEMCKAYNIDYR